MPACVLRPSRNDSAKQADAVIKLLVTRLRQDWPQVRLVVRGDSGFCRQRLIRWCERRSVGYVISVAHNARRHQLVEAGEQELESAFVRERIKQRMVSEFRYSADSWNIESPCCHAPDVRRTCLYADAASAQDRLDRYRIGPGNHRYDPGEAAQDRRGYPVQYPPPCLRSTDRVLPRHDDKQRGKGKVRPEFALQLIS